MTNDQIGLIDAIIAGFFRKAVAFKDAMSRIAAILVDGGSPLGAVWTARLAKCPARGGREAAVVVMLQAHGELRQVGLSRIKSYLYETP